MKSIYPLVLNGAKNMVDFINKKIACNKTEIFDARDIGGRFTCDVTTSCVFGFDAKAFSSEDSEIFELGKKMMDGITESNQSLFPKTFSHNSDCVRLSYGSAKNMIYLLILVFLALVFIVSFLVFSHFNRFEKQNIPGPRTEFFFGNTKKSILKN